MVLVQTLRMRCNQEAWLPSGGRVGVMGQLSRVAVPRPHLP